MSEVAVIIGAGPAGLTAAYELVTRTSIRPIILEQTGEIGGISRTAVHNGNRIDIGGHRFFSKSDRVMEWWKAILPIQGMDSKDDIRYKQEFPHVKCPDKLSMGGPDPEKVDRVMLIRRRLSRIFFLRKFFDYPISINGRMISSLGIVRIGKIGFSYAWSRVAPPKRIISLEDFFISRFGRELYNTFFKDYTEKVWGVPCAAIAADWGAQRIKKLSVSRAIIHAAKSVFKKKKTIAQKDVDTSLIEQFMYPKLGPGQMWETVAQIIRDKGGVIIQNAEVTGIVWSQGKIERVAYLDSKLGGITSLNGDHFISTMPVKDLVYAMGEAVPNGIKEISQDLRYRDFITVGLLLNELKIKNETSFRLSGDLIPDNWVYIQERDVKIGRLQIFNNWSPYMVADPQKVWIGLEYFCNEGDELWQKSDEEFTRFAIAELDKIGIIEKDKVVDHTVIRAPKAYPAYFGSYSNFGDVRAYLDGFENLFLVGRNGMHRYNNQDHSMLTAMAAVDNIVCREKSKNNIWDVNVEEDYHEEK